MITVKHPNYPGAFHFRGQLSVQDFLSWKANYNDEIEITLLGTTYARLPIDECSITFKEDPNRDKSYAVYPPAWGL